MAASRWSSPSGPGRRKRPDPGHVRRQLSRCRFSPLPRPSRDRVRRPLQRRQVVAPERADGPADPGPHQPHPRPDPGLQRVQRGRSLLLRGSPGLWLRPGVAGAATPPRAAPSGISPEPRSRRRRLVAGPPPRSLPRRPCHGRIPGRAFHTGAGGAHQGGPGAPGAPAAAPGGHRGPTGHQYHRRALRADQRTDERRDCRVEEGDRAAGG